MVLMMVFEERERDREMCVSVENEDVHNELSLEHKI